MRRLAFILLAFLLFVSCAPREDALSYQNGDILAECKINGKYNANIIKKEGFRALELTSGSVSGISFVYDNGVWRACIDATACICLVTVRTIIKNRTLSWLLVM